MAKRTVVDCDFCQEEIEGDVFEIRVTRKLKGSSEKAKQISRQDACEACAERAIADVPAPAPGKPEE